MDDLLPVILKKNISKAIMKIDIEGAEHLALASASHLFSTIHIPYLFMEMAVQKKLCGSKSPQVSEDRRLISEMFVFLKRHGFMRVYRANLDGQPLNPNACNEYWPSDVVWVHNKQTFPP